MWWACCCITLVLRLLRQEVTWVQGQPGLLVTMTTCQKGKREERKWPRIGGIYEKQRWWQKRWQRLGILREDRDSKEVTEGYEKTMLELTEWELQRCLYWSKKIKCRGQRTPRSHTLVCFLSRSLLGSPFSQLLYRYQFPSLVVWYYFFFF